jgi:ethanolamine permease
VNSDATGVGVLQQNTLGWVLIASLGVAIAISGNFSGWNYGLASGGWGGMFCAAVLMAVLYVGLTQVVGELAAALPAAAGFDGYVTRAFGERVGGAAGMFLFVGLSLGTGLAATFIAAYLESVSGFGGWTVKALLIVAVTLVQARGARDSTRVTLVTGGIAVLVLCGFCLMALPQFRAERLFTEVPGSPRTLFPNGLASVFAAVPFALFFFVGVEQAALGASEARDVSRTIPRALTTAVTVALAIGFSVLILATGAVGVSTLAGADDPLYVAIHALGGHAAGPLATAFVSTGAIVSLLATFFSLNYAASRQGYSLAAAGSLPRALARTNRRHAPHWSLLLVAVLGGVGAAFDPNVVVVVFVFLLNLCYQFTLAAYISLRRRAPELQRPFRARGGTVTAAVTLMLSLLVIAACVKQQPVATLATGCAVLAYAVLAGIFRGISTRPA